MSNAAETDSSLRETLLNAGQEVDPSWGREELLRAVKETQAKKLAELSADEDERPLKEATPKKGKRTSPKKRVRP